MRLKAHEIELQFEAILDAFRNREPIKGALRPSVLTDNSGRPLSSWRYAIAPFLERTPRAVRLEYAWDSEENEYWLRLDNRVYCFNPNGDQPCSTGVLAIVGPGTGFDDEAPRRMSQLPAHTILIVESRNSGLHWMEPGDIDIRNVPPRIGGSEERAICGNTPLGVFVGFADEEVWLLRNDVPFETLSRFFTVVSAAANNRQELLGEYRVFLNDNER